jgi:protease-4
MMNKKVVWTVVIVVVVVFIGFWYAGITFLMRSLSKSAVSVKKGTVLVGTLSGSLPEEPPGPLGKIFSIKKKLTVKEAVDLLAAARDDERVEVLLLKSGVIEDMGWAKARELRNAILDFKMSGKPVIGYMEAGSDKDYYLLSCADSIVMPELGMLVVDGLVTKVGFAKGTYGKLGIKWQGVRKGKYKAATEPYTREEMSEEFKEEIDDLLDDIYAEYLDAVAASRGMTSEALATLVDKGPYLSARSALEAGLIDRVACLHDIESELGISEEGKKGVSWQDYSASLGSKLKLGVKKIAVVHAVGMITTGKSKENPWSGKTMGSTTISDAIRKAADNSQVAAIIMRVDSPGGSALASDIILEAVAAAKKEKPFVVSMGDVAASGGYYISCGADAIIAEPSTITGSIGVLALVPDLEELFDKIGYNIETVKRGEHADFLSGERPLEDWERTTLEDFIQVVYDRFVHLVAEGRERTYDEIDAIGQGRVWAGTSARDIGLVDDLGDFSMALRVAKDKASIPEDEDVQFVYYPKKKTLFEMIEEGDFLDKIALSVWRRLPEDVKSAAGAARVSSLFEEEPVLLLAPETIEVE